MSRFARIDDLQLEQDARFQRCEWFLQRVGWLALGVLLAAGLAGFLGHGPASDARVGSDKGEVLVEYSRYLRRFDPTTLSLYVAPGAVENQEVRVSLNDAWLRGVEIRRITPEAREERLGGERQTFVFRATDLREAGWIAIRVDPDRCGALDGELQINDGPAVRFHQFVWP